MASIYKKILFGGYDKKDYKFMRKRINDFLEHEDEEHPYRKTHKKAKYCKYNKGEHEFELVSSEFYSFLGIDWKTYTCKHCGKRKYN